MFECGLLPPEAGLGASEVVEEPALSGRVGQEPLVCLGRLLVVPAREVVQAFGGALPRRRSERLAGLPSHNQDRGPRLLGNSLAAGSGGANEDEGASGRINLVAVHGERRAPGGYEVELLVLRAALADLVVLADQVNARLLRKPGIDAERTDVEMR